MTDEIKTLPPNDLAGRIQQLRKKRGLSQEELANAVNVSRQAVSKWESGQALPELEKLLAISDFFQVSCDYLLKGREQPAPNQAAAQPAPTAAVIPANRQLYLINATLFNYVGLLAGWALWDYWQLSICAFFSLLMSIIGGAVLAVGLSSSRGEDKQRLWRGFWRWNIWPIAQLVLALIYSALCTGGRLLSPVISILFFGWAGGGLFLFCWGAWLIISVSVWRGCRPKN